jgi:O-antigen ligase
VFVVVLVVDDPDRVRRWLRLFGKAIPYLLLWFPLAIVLDAAFSDKVPLIPDSRIPIVAHRTGNLAVIAAIALAYLWLVDRDSELFDRRQRTTLTVLATVVILFAATRNRGGFVSGALVLLIAFVMMRRERTNMVGIMVGVSILLLGFALFSNLKIELFAQREVSFEQFMDNFVSIFDRNAGGSRQETTTQWRLDIWGRVLEDVSQDHPIAGFGPGPDLGKRYGITTDEDVPLRNPHNSHVGILARTGFVGVALWVFFWITWFVEMLRLRQRLLARGWAREGAIIAWLIAAVVGVLVNAVFDPTLEGPQVAWWLWAFVGFGIAIAVLDRVGQMPAISLAAPPKAEFETVATPS